MQKLYLEHTLSEAVSGRIGLWSKNKQLLAPVDYMATPARLSLPVQVGAMVEPHVQS